MTERLPNQRHHFDIPSDIVYLNAATMGPMPNQAIAAGVAGLKRKIHPWNITSEDFFTDTGRIRPKIASLINANESDIAICPAASYGLATAAQNLKISKGEDIVILADQFPSNVYAWQDLAAKTGAKVRTVGGEDSNMPLSDQLLEAIDENTALIACGNVRWTDGAQINLEAVGRRARDVGAALVVDLSQSCGAMQFDVQAVKPDFLVCVGYKWLLGPYGMGFMYVDPKYHAGAPLEQNWIARKGSTDFTALTDYQNAYGPGASRFDMGERSNFALLPALEAAIDLILDWGVDRVEATLAAMNATLCDKLGSIGLTALTETERGPHYVGAALPKHTPPDLTKRLATRNIFVSQRGSCLRITPHLYNTEDDIDQLIEALSCELAVATA